MYVEQTTNRRRAKQVWTLPAVVQMLLIASVLHLIRVSDEITATIISFVGAPYSAREIAKHRNRGDD